jgi:hypothetical protein
MAAPEVIAIDTAAFAEISEGLKPTRDQIAELAYLMWNDEGRPDGLEKQEQYWLRAEAYLQGFHAGEDV